MQITVLCGGLGGARIALALKQEDLLEGTTFVTNVGDDWTVGGLRVCPDTDAVLYALGGVFDEDRGWGVAGDTFPGPRPDEPDWFALGNLDRRHHQRRMALMQRGGLAAATEALAEEMGITARVVPVTGDVVETRVVVDGGELGFQEWLVRERAQPVVRDVQWPAAASAAASPEALTAMAEADVVVISSSSPIASIEPILRIPGVLSALENRAASGHVVAVSPLVQGITPASDRDRSRARARVRLLAAWGIAPDPIAVLRRYRPWTTRAVLDPADAELATELGLVGFHVELAPIVDQTPASRRALVRAIVDGAA